MGKNKKIIRVLLGSLAGLLFLCVIVFSLMTTVMTQQNNAALNQVANSYMMGMGIQIQNHFETLVEMRILQIKGIEQAFPSKDAKEMNDLVKETLGNMATSRGFTHMLLLDDEGNTEVISGSAVKVEGKEHFLETMNRGEMLVTIGSAEDGSAVLLYGVSFDSFGAEGYPMSNGSRGAAMVLGLPIERLNEALSLGVDNSLIFSSIIRSDGNYVIKNSDVTIPTNNCFEWMQLNGQEYGMEEIDTLISDMQQAMAAREPYSAEIPILGEMRHFYCEPLANSEWYMLSVMPHGLLDEAIHTLGEQRIVSALISCTVMVLGMILVFLIYWKVSRRQMAELAIAREEAMEASKAKSEFLSNMSHDIRTPLNAIVGMTSIAASHMKEPDKVQDCLQKITLSSKHLLGLINNVLDMSKIESGKLTLNRDLISLQETMDSIVSIIQPQIKSKNQVFDIFIRSIQNESVYGDSVRLNQVLLNLLSNALKFTPPEGKITVTVTQEDSPKGEAYVRTHFWVKDTGIGMTKEFQKTIFESFVREDNARVQQTEGSGLGMAITKYIVDKAGGTIDLDSEPGKGTEFHVCFDMERGEEQDKEMRLPGWEVLVVDDDEQLCCSAAEALNEIGVHAEWAVDGSTAVEMAEKRHVAHQDYHVVLLDRKMPGMNGIETAKELRRHIGEEVPLLLISAYDWSDIEEEAREAGINGFIAKPLFKSTLFHSLIGFLESEKQKELSKETEMDFTGRRLLVAEDNELNWEIANELLSSAGFMLDWAENGQACVERLQTAAPGYYDAILMDLRMPVMNGFEATKAIRALNREDAKRIPIIAMTADSFTEDIKKCMDCGMNAHVAKPLNIPELLRLLQNSFS